MRRAIVVAALSAISFDAYAESFRIGGEIGLYHNDLGIETVTALTEVIDADITLVDTVALVAELPFVQTFGSNDLGLGTDARFRIGNPFLAAYFHSQGDIFTLRIGGGLAIPAAQLPNDNGFWGAGAAYAFGNVMYALQKPWLWSPETLPIAAPSLRLGADFSLVTIDGRADIVILVPLSDGQDVEVALPLSAGAMVHLWFLGLGADFGATILPTDDQDQIQLSLSPRITATFGLIELEARLTMNLDKQYGFAFEDEGFFGFFLGVHAVF